MMTTVGISATASVTIKAPYQSTFGPLRLSWRARSVESGIGFVSGFRGGESLVLRLEGMRSGRRTDDASHFRARRLIAHDKHQPSHGILGSWPFGRLDISLRSRFRR